MDYKFNYSLDKNDLINFELFKLKSSKFMSMIYITVLIMLSVKKIMRICLFLRFILLQ